MMYHRTSNTVNLDNNTIGMASAPNSFDKATFWLQKHHLMWCVWGFYPVCVCGVFDLYCVTLSPYIRGYQEIKYYTM